MQAELRLAFAAIAVAIPGAASPASAGRWHNHIDASMINEIVPRGSDLYVATFGGMLVYDTTHASFTQYTNDTGLPSNALRCLTFDDKGDIYAGTDDIGVAKVRLTNGQLKLVRSLSEQIDGLASNTINSIAVWGDQIVYGSTPGAGTIRNDFASARFFERDGLPGPDVFDVLPVGNEVWMATAGGAATLNALGIIQTVAGTPTNARALATDGTNIYVGTSTGVRRYDPSSSTWTDIGPAQRIFSLAWDGTTLWSGGTRFFNRYSGSGTTWTSVRTDSITNRYQFSDGSGNSETRGLAVFGNNDVFFGNVSTADLRGTNLMHYDGTHIVNLRANTPGGNDVRRLDFDIDGSLWASFGSFYVGKLMPDGNWLNYNSAITGIQIPTNAFTNIAFLADSQGHKWFSSLSDPNRPPLKALDELDDKQDASYGNDVWTRHQLGSGGGDTYGTLRPVRAAEDPVGNRWFMADDFIAEWEGINILSRDGTSWFQMNPSKESRMISGNVIDVAFGNVETYVAFLNDGVYRWVNGGYTWPVLTAYQQDAWIPFVNKSQLPSTGDITRLAYRQSDGRLWIATTSGLFYTYGGTVSSIPTYTGIVPGIVSPKVQDILLDRDDNLWVATDLGLNRISRKDDNDIQTFLSQASFVLLSGLRYPIDVISPLANADCRSLALDPTRDVLYIGTFGGMSAYDFSTPPATPSDLAKVYVYPNPVYTSKGHTGIKVGNLTGPVTVEVYDLEGELVDDPHRVNTSADVAWDLTTRSGILAGSGNYIVRIIGEKGSVQRSIALIR